MERPILMTQLLLAVALEHLSTGFEQWIWVAFFVLCLVDYANTSHRDSERR